MLSSSPIIYANEGLSLGEAQGEDNIQRHAGVFRSRGETQDHSGGQSPGSKSHPYRCKEALVKDVDILTYCVQAKKFVESLPKVLKENQSKEDAEKMKATFEGLGAVVKLE